MIKEYSKIYRLKITEQKKTFKHFADQGLANTKIIFSIASTKSYGNKSTENGRFYGIQMDGPLV